MIILARIVLALDEQRWVLIILVHTEHLGGRLLEVGRVNLVIGATLEEALVQLPVGEFFVGLRLLAGLIVNLGHHVLDDEGSERVHLSEHRGDQTTANVSSLIAGLGLSEVCDGLEVHLVSLLSNDAEVAEELREVRLGSALLSLHHLLLLFLLVRGQFSLEVIVEKLDWRLLWLVLERLILVWRVGLNKAHLLVLRAGSIDQAQELFVVGATRSQLVVILESTQELTCIISLDSRRKLLELFLALSLRLTLHFTEKVSKLLIRQRLIVASVVALLKVHVGLRVAFGFDLSSQSLSLAQLLLINVGRCTFVLALSDDVSLFFSHTFDFGLFDGALFAFLGSRLSSLLFLEHGLTHLRLVLHLVTEELGSVLADLELDPLRVLLIIFIAVSSIFGSGLGPRLVLGSTFGASRVARVMARSLRSAADTLILESANIYLRHEVVLLVKG